MNKKYLIINGVKFYEGDYIKKIKSYNDIVFLYFLRKKMYIETFSSGCSYYKDKKNKPSMSSNIYIDINLLKILDYGKSNLENFKLKKATLNSYIIYLSIDNIDHLIDLNFTNNTFKIYKIITLDSKKPYKNYYYKKYE